MYALDKIKLDIVKKINQALKKKIVQASDLVYPPDARMGDLSLPCFEAARQSGKNPNEIAEFLVKKLAQELNSEASEFSSIKVAGPYLNFVFSKKYLSQSVITDIGKIKDEYGRNKSGRKKRVMIEYSNANTHKEYHVGHLRNLCYGDAVNRVLGANGYKNIPVSYINDFGIHVAKTLWYFSVHQQGRISSQEERGALLGEMYSQAVATLGKDKTGKGIVNLLMKRIESRRGEDYRLWQKTRQWSIEHFARIYRELGVEFQKIYYESEYIETGRKLVAKLLKRGVLQESQGAVIADLDKLGVLVFLRSDGSALYPVADLPLAQEKFKRFKLNKSIYVVDVRQSLYFKQLFAVLDKLGVKGDKVHLSYEFVKLPSGMMSSRSGNVITYEDLKERLFKRAAKETRKRHKDWSNSKVGETVKKLSVGAIKFELVKVGADNVITFDINKALSFEGFTAAYLQYTYARIRSVLRKANSREFEYKWPQTNFQKLNNSKENNLVLKLAKYPGAVERAGKNYDPAEIAKYLFDLSQNFNDYYHSVPVLKAKKEAREARLVLISAVSQVIRNGLDLLGIEVMEEM